VEEKLGTINSTNNIPNAIVGTSTSTSTITHTSLGTGTSTSTSRIHFAKHTGTSISTIVQKKQGTVKLICTIFVAYY
jgi:hypothetical protein